MVEVKSLEKSKDGRDYVTTIICQDQYIRSIEIVRRIFPREKISVDLLKMANSTLLKACKVTALTTC